MFPLLGVSFLSKGLLDGWVAKEFWGSIISHLVFLGGLFQYNLVSIEYQALRCMFGILVDLSSRLNCAPPRNCNDGIGNLANRVSNCFNTRTSVRYVWYCLPRAIRTCLNNQQPSTPPLPNNAILQNPYLEPDAMGGLANSHLLDVAAPHVSSVLHEAQRQFARCFHQVSCKNAASDERGAA